MDICLRKSVAEEKESITTGISREEQDNVWICLHWMSLSSHIASFSIEISPWNKWFRKYYNTIFQLIVKIQVKNLWQMKNLKNQEKAMTLIALIIFKINPVIVIIAAAIYGAIFLREKVK